MGAQQKIQPFAFVKGTPAIAAGVLTLDLALYSYFAVSLNANITSIVISNAPPGPCSFMLELKADGTPRTVAWPGGFGNSGNPTMTSTNNKRDKVSFDSTDGSTWDIAVFQQNL